MKRTMEVNILQQMYSQGLFENPNSEYLTRMFFEDELLELSKIIKSNENNIENFTEKLLIAFANNSDYNKYFDWNIGSTIQHFEPRLVINAFIKTPQTYNLINSIGLTWVLGELKIKDEKTIDYLIKVIKESINSEAWWRAAFSLEQLNQGEALVLLKRSLKAEGLKDLNFYLNDLSNKKSIIGILLHSNNKNVRETIYPSLKSKFLSEKQNEILINCVWLLGRFRLIDRDIIKKILEIFKDSTNYELIYYTCFSIQEVSSTAFLDIFKNFLCSEDSLLRKMAVRGISNIDLSSNQKILEEVLIKETNSNVISEICIGLYKMTNTITKQKNQLKKDFRDVENGLIFDDSDKWYADPSIYEVFSFSEDPENICLNLILNEINKRNISVVNPIDIATGTGRALHFFVDNLNYSGKFYGIDKSNQMIQHLKTSINRRHIYIHNIELVESSIVDMCLSIKSNFIISSFGFPSKITDKNLCFKELESISNHLSDDGIFVTLGWDESFNDELNNYWYRHIPDNIDAKDFESWRVKRMSQIDSPRNCNLTWYKKGINVPLQYNNLRESAKIMGYLFGRDATENIINNNITEWGMSLGITLNTKNEIENILKQQKQIS